MIRDSGQCVISLPTAALTETAARIGDCSSDDVDKFSQFGFTAEPATTVAALSCASVLRASDAYCTTDVLVERYNFFFYKVVKAPVAPSPKTLETPHCLGDS